MCLWEKVSAPNTKLKLPHRVRTGSAVTVAQ